MFTFYFWMFLYDIFTKQVNHEGTPKSLRYTSISTIGVKESFLIKKIDVSEISARTKFLSLSYLACLWGLSE